jgi:hypothetical protein
MDGWIDDRSRARISKRSSTQAPVVLEAVGIEPRRVAAGGHGAAQPVVAHVEELQAAEVRHLRRDAAVDGVVADVQKDELLRQLHAGEVEAQGVARQVHLLHRLGPAEQARRVAGEAVARQVDLREGHGGELGGHAAGEVVVRQPEVGHLRRLAEEQRREGAREAVAAEVDAVQARERGERGRDGAGERVEGEVELAEPGERAEERRHGSGDGRPGDGEEGEVGEPGDGRRDGAGDAREVVQPEGPEVGEAGDGVRDGAREVGVLEHGEADDAAGGGVAVDVVPVAARGGGRPGREVVWVAQRRLDGQQRGLVAGVAAAGGGGGGGSGDEEDKDGAHPHRRRLHLADMHRHSTVLRPGSLCSCG